VIYSNKKTHKTKELQSENYISYDSSIAVIDYNPLPLWLTN
jgi:hypothetical protein